MTEDNRIRKIREALAVSDNDVSVPYAYLSDAVRAILDSAPPAPDPDDASPEELRAEIGRLRNEMLRWQERATEYAEALRVAAEPAQAPRVFFPGDTVPAGVPLASVVNTTEGRFLGLLEADNVDRTLSTHVGPAVELRGVPSLEEWQASVNRARAEREADRG